MPSKIIRRPPIRKRGPRVERRAGAKICGKSNGVVHLVDERQRRHPMRLLADRARKDYFAWADFQAAYHLFELDQTTDNNIAFLRARAALNAVFGSGQ